MDIQYYKKINKYISLKLYVDSGDSKHLVLAPKQSSRVSEYNDNNDDFKVYDPIEKRVFVFTSNSTVESETVSCPLPLTVDTPESFVGVDENNEKFSTLIKNILDAIDLTERSSDNIDFLKQSSYYSSNMSLSCMKLITSMRMFGVKDIKSFKNNTPENLLLCKENWKNKIISHADAAISSLLSEKTAANENNDLESSEEIGIIIQMIEDVKVEISQPEYFESSQTTDDLIKKWPPILLPVPLE